jgi:NADH-quinone oxidoreductase subunit M
MGMPGFSGFVAEFPIFMGLWREQPIAALIAVVGIVITAAYVMRIVRSVFFGKMPEEFEGHVGGVTALDKVALVLLAGIMIAIGVMPSLMAPMVESGAEAILRLVGGA